MFRKELMMLGLLGALVFVSVAGLSAWMTRILTQNAHMLVVDTLPGLVNAGEALRVMDQNWEKILRLTYLPTEAARSNLIVEIKSQPTDDLWNHYEKAVFDPRDREQFLTVQTSQQNARVVAEQFFQLVREQRLTDAQNFLTNKFEPAFKVYRGEAGKLFEFNKETGKQRSERILGIGRWMPLIAGATGIMMFLLGFIVGLRGAFTGLQIISSNK